MSLLDTTETNKQLENELDKIVMKELRDHYYRADAEAFNIRCQLHDSDKGKELAAYDFYRIEYQNLRKDLVTMREALNQSRQEISDLYANKTVLLRLIAELYHILDFNLTKPQMEKLTQFLKNDLDEIDFARVKAYAKSLQ